jgi:hypothetical protein
VEVRGRVLVELERSSERVQDECRRVPIAALLQADVVLGAATAAALAEGW